jgi:hypothetical protein
MAWTHYECSISGKPALILVDQSFSSKGPIKELPQLSWFGVYCLNSSGASSWDPDETETLNRIEDDLIKLCGAFGRGWVVYVLRIATPGIREYYLYHSDLAELEKAFRSLMSIYPDYRIEFETTTDSAWEQYAMYSQSPTA